MTQAEGTEPYHTEAEKLRTGEYFREAQQYYESQYVDLISERYWYFIMLIISVVVLMLALTAKDALYPLNVSIPFAYETADVYDQTPIMRKIGSAEGDFNIPVQEFLLQNYVRRREEYDINLLDGNARAVRQHSSPEVFAAFQKMMALDNPESPVVVYQRQAVRTIRVLSTRISGGGENSAAVVLFEATVSGPAGVEVSRWMANIAFRFTPIALDKSESKRFTPLEFLITSYTLQHVNE